METLYVVATPIGNLEDITLRALTVLKEVDLIVCEDTRHTGKLLQHFQIKKPLLSYHQHNERVRVDKILASLKDGKKVALVSDAGTPGISDPGAILVRAILEAGGKVEPLPGASALITALSASGLPSDRFLFEGFLPNKTTPRKKQLESLKEQPQTLVFYEAPHRLLKTLSDMKEILGSRQACVVRELTKIHEEFVSNSLEELIQNFKSRASIKGEFVLIVDGFKGTKTWSNTPEEAALKLIQEQGLSKKEAAKQVAHERGIPSRTLYQNLI